jgi:hypothetical protein
VDLVVVRAELAVAATAVPGLNAYPGAPASLEVPCFYSGESEIDYDQTFAKGVDELQLTCYLMTSAAEDLDGQRLLDAFLGRGPQSIKAALEADRTLRGTVSDMCVRRMQGYRTYGSGTDTFYGAQIIVRAIGQAEE